MPRVVAANDELELDVPEAIENPYDGRVKFVKDAGFWVWALAQVMGKKPKRRWLLFAYAPRGGRKGVKITIPDYRAITLDVPPEGVYAVVKEADGSIHKIKEVNRRAQALLEAPAKDEEWVRKMEAQLAAPFAALGGLLAWLWRAFKKWREQGRRIEVRPADAGSPAPPPPANQP